MKGWFRGLASLDVVEGLGFRPLGFRIWGAEGIGFGSLEL